jgi:hypothetical protein
VGYWRFRRCDHIRTFAAKNEPEFLKTPARIAESCVVGTTARRQDEWDEMRQNGDKAVSQTRSMIRPPARNLSR